MAIGILSAMPEEIDLIFEEMTLLEKVESGMRTYYRGVLCEREIVAVFSRCGKVASASTATDMINKFDIQEILFVGVAGAMNPQISIGDIVIGDRVYQHDMDASPIFPEFEIPLLNRKWFNTDPEMTERLNQACIDTIENHPKSFNTKIMKELSLEKPNIYVGAMGSGDQFISNPSVRDEIVKKLPDLLCVEMEGGAVGQVCYEFGVPFGSVRVISDTADHEAAFNFQRFIDQIASVYSLEILKKYLQLTS